MQLDQQRERFRAYVARFAGETGPLHPMLRFKLDHTERVADNCRAIALGEGWDGQRADLAEAAGIWHDVARFEQYQRFQTFADPRSFDHGERGAQLLAEHDFIAGLPQSEKACLVTAVRLHNRLAIPPEVTGLEREVLAAVRDADKLDILGVFVETFRTRSYEKFPDLLLHVDPDGPLSPAVVEAAAAGQTAPYQHIRSLLDMRLLGVGWLYDVNFAPTFALMRSRGLFRGIRRELPDEPAVRAILDRAEERFAIDF